MLDNSTGEEEEEGGDAHHEEVGSHEFFKNFCYPWRVMLNSHMHNKLVISRFTAWLHL